MKNPRLLICDTDKAYVEALVAYLLSNKETSTVATFYDKSLFERDVGRYDIGILGDGFIELAEKKQGIGHVIYLSSRPGDIYDGCDTIYKFQDMRTFTSRINEVQADRVIDTSIGNDSYWIGVYSPIHHELQLPFALACAKQMAADSDVLFLDIEENSILGDLIDTSGAKSLMDYIYLLEGDNAEAFSDIPGYSGFSYLAPMPFFTDLSQIDQTLWEKFFSSISRLKYDRVILLFDGAISGMAQAIPYINELILLTKPGDFYKKSNRRIEAYIQSKDYKVDIKHIELSMNGKNLIDGTYKLEQLLSGNLGRFVHSAMKMGAAHGVV